MADSACCLTIHILLLYAANIPSMHAPAIRTIRVSDRSFPDKSCTVITSEIILAVCSVQNAISAPPVRNHPILTGSKYCFMKYTSTGTAPRAMIPIIPGISSFVIDVRIMITPAASQPIPSVVNLIFCSSGITLPGMPAVLSGRLTMPCPVRPL